MSACSYLLLPCTGDINNPTHLVPTVLASLSPEAVIKTVGYPLSLTFIQSSPFSTSSSSLCLSVCLAQYLMLLPCTEESSIILRISYQQYFTHFLLRLSRMWDTLYHKLLSPPPPPLPLPLFLCLYLVQYLLLSCTEDINDPLHLVPTVLHLLLLLLFVSACRYLLLPCIGGSMIICISYLVPTALLNSQLFILRLPLVQCNPLYSPQILHNTVHIVTALIVHI